jgi:hypothetical protein
MAESVYSKLVYSKTPIRVSHRTNRGAGVIMAENIGGVGAVAVGADGASETITKKESKEESKELQAAVPVLPKFPLPPSMVIEILSYLIHDYHELARFRLLSKYFNENTFSLSKQTGFLKSCSYENGIESKYHPSYFTVDFSCNFDFDENRGTRIDLSHLTETLFDSQTTLKLESLVVFHSGDSIQEGICKEKKDDADYDMAICHKLCETESFKEFVNLSADALECGLYLPISFNTSSYEEAPRKGCYLYKCSAAVVLELSFDDTTENLGENENIIHLSLSDGACDLDSLHPIKLLPRDKDSIFRGFVKDGKVRVPICLTWFNDDIQSTSDLYLNKKLNAYRYNMTLPEGVTIVDKAISRKLHNDLMNQIDDLAKTQEIDYHPHSKDIVRDLVHPALYAYVKGVSKVESMKEVPPCKSAFEPVQHNRDEPESDYWGRAYEKSLKYQWLPTYFDIDTDGSCKIRDYINNLAPRSKFEELYSSLEQLFTQALPQLESVYNYGLNMRTRLNHQWGYDHPYKLLEESDDAHYSLKGQRLQVITKIVDYELGPGETYEGVWHVEGMSHEEIVATAIYFLHRDDSITGGNILFRRAFHTGDAAFLENTVSNYPYEKSNLIVEKGLVPLGQVETRTNRLLVFPNSHVHKVRKIQNIVAEEVLEQQKASNESTDESNNETKKRRIDTTSVSKHPDSNNITQDKQKRRIVVFFLVNPEKRIVSTREVKPQQKEAGGSMSREEAFEHRLELMKERKYTKQDWNVREISLCEH